MEYRDVKLRIELESSAAASGVSEANAAAPVLPGAVPVSPGAGRGRQPQERIDRVAVPRELTDREEQRLQDRDDLDEARRLQQEAQQIHSETRQALRQAKNIGKGLVGRGPGLDKEVEGVLGDVATVVPVLGPATLKALLLTEKYGPAAASFVEQSAGQGPLTTAARKTLESGARVIAEGRSTLNSIGRAFEATTELAGVQLVLNGTGNVDGDALRRYAATSRRIAEVDETAARNKRIHDLQAAGGALGSAFGNAVYDTLNALRAGLTNAVGK